MDIFSIMPVEVFADDRLSKTDFRVLGTILSFRNRNTSLCCPKREQIADRCGLPLCKISTATTRLVELGWLEKVGNGGRSSACHYRVSVPVFLTERVTDSVTVSMPKTVTDSVTVTKSVTVTDSVTKTVTDSVRGIKQTSKQTKERDNAREGFAVFWQAYPRKVSKAQAEKAWDKVAPDECLLRVIVAAVEGSKTSAQWQRDNGQFIPHPATWLNGRRWEDELPAPVTPTGGASPGLPGQSGRAISPSLGNVNQRGGYGARRQSGGTSRREHSAAMGAALDRIIGEEFGS